MVQTISLQQEINEQFNHLSQQERQQILEWLEGREIPEEEWETIPNTSGMYEVSNRGRIRSWYIQNQYGGKRKRDKPHTMSPYMTRCGYLVLRIVYKGERHPFSVHRLVAEAFISNAENKPEVNHRLGIKTFNWAINLEWNTTSENLKHAYRNGLCIKPKGEKHGRAKLTENDVLDIRNAYALGCFTQKEIAEAYGVCRQSIGDIINRRNWTHI